jgi:hypothetical protein
VNALLSPDVLDRPSALLSVQLSGVPAGASVAGAEFGAPVSARELTGGSAAVAAALAPLPGVALPQQCATACDAACLAAALGQPVPAALPADDAADAARPATPPPEPPEGAGAGGSPSRSRARHRTAHERACAAIALPRAVAGAVLLLLAACCVAIPVTFDKALSGDALWSSFAAPGEYLNIEVVSAQGLPPRPVAGPHGADTDVGAVPAGDYGAPDATSTLRNPYIYARTWPPTRDVYRTRTANATLSPVFQARRVGAGLLPAAVRLHRTVAPPAVARAAVAALTVSARAAPSRGRAHPAGPHAPRRTHAAPYSHHTTPLQQEFTFDQGLARSRRVSLQLFDQGPKNSPPLWLGTAMVRTSHARVLTASERRDGGPRRFASQALTTCSSRAGSRPGR